MKTFKEYITEDSNIDISHVGNGKYVLSLNHRKIGQAFITRYGKNYSLSAIDIRTSQQRKGYGTMLLSRIADDLKRLGVETLSSSNEGSGTVQMMDKVFGRNNVKHYSGSEEISYEEAIKIMDTDFGYTKSVANLRGIKDPRRWVTESTGFPYKMVQTPHDENAGYVLVPVNVKKFDELLQQVPDIYVGPNGAGEIHGRYERFKEFLKTGIPIEASSGGVSEDGLRAGFSNGRHRWAVLRDMGFEYIPVSMDRGSLKRARALGLLEKNEKL